MRRAKIIATDLLLNLNGMLPLAERAVLDRKLAERGETVIVMTGWLSDAVISLFMKIHRVRELTARAARAEEIG